MMDDDRVLAATARDVAGEPLLGPRQGMLVHAVTLRLTTGSPFTSADLVALSWSAKVLGLPHMGPEPSGA
jgi:hypothetical protein